jgi:ubiquinone/menaquinone biosynthesis C-methylase UbiE
MTAIDNARVRAHAEAIDDQFTRQAAVFAKAPALHAKATIELLVEAAQPKPGDSSLDVCCGPGSVVAAFAPRVARAVGLDATAAMLDEARALASEQGLTNIEWHQGDVYALPFADAVFDIVSCRFAFHHLEKPALVFAEMVRVARRGGPIVLCDAVCSDEGQKAEAFNRMEKFRDASTVEFRTLGFLQALFRDAGLPEPEARFFAVPVEREAVIARSFPVGDDRAGLRATLDAAVEDDAMGVGARRDGATMRFEYRSVVLTARK